MKEANYSTTDMMNRGGARRCSYMRAAERCSPPAKPARRHPRKDISKCEEVCGPSCATFGQAGIDPGTVDQRSRKAFPLVFLVLNIVYWGYFLTITSGGVDVLIAEVMEDS